MKSQHLVWPKNWKPLSSARPLGPQDTADLREIIFRQSHFKASFHKNGVGLESRICPQSFPRLLEELLGVAQAHPNPSLQEQEEKQML